MAIATRAKKASPISQATAVTAATLVERHSSQQSKRPGRSPHTTNVNIHLADINRPTAYTDSVLQVLQPRYAALDDPHENPNKGSLTAAPDSPTGVNSQEEAPAALDDGVASQDNSKASAIQPSTYSRSSESARLQPQGLL